MFRKLALVALAALAQGCQQPEQELEVAAMPEPAREENRASAAGGDAAAGEARLSLWGVGAPAQSGPIGGAAARLDGVLSRAGGCLVVATDGGRRVQPVFPASKAQWDEASGTLRLAGRSYRVGERITLGGGGVASPSAYAREEGVRIAACPVSDLWVVIA